MDSQEIPFEITRTDLVPSGLSGTLTGRVAGRLKSTVTLAFKVGREAFTVLSPEDGTHLVADPCEPGLVIVKSINPVAYVPWVCGVP